MPIVSIHHRTTYRYRNPVAFGEHRILARPLEGPDQRVLSAETAITPGPSARRYLADVAGNLVEAVSFKGRSSHVTFESFVTLDHSPTQPAFDDEAEALGQGGRFLYDPLDMADLATSVARRFEDPTGEVETWARRFVRPVGVTGLRSLLGDMTTAIHREFSYGVRLEGPPQSPLATLERRSGSCRDFAMLMMEAARSLGLAARFGTGYVYSTSTFAGAAGGRRLGGGHTHAWVRVFTPHCGWIDFDPTNGIIGSRGLVRVAVACDPRQTIPLHGTWAGLANDYLGMEVEVDVRAESEPMAQPAPRLRIAQGR
jgi:transglutaminase-like putative cysteine protease